MSLLETSSLSFVLSSVGPKVMMMYLCFVANSRLWQYL